MTIIDFIKFPDGQLHLKKCDLFPVPVVHCRIRNFEDIGKLYLMKNFLSMNGKSTSDLTLKIYWLASARWDRPISKDESFDLSVFADLINNLGFKAVQILDPHSYASFSAIKNSMPMDYTDSFYNRFRFKDNLNKVLVIPDAGAEKKGHRFLEWQDKTKFIQCLKHRNGWSVSIEPYLSQGLDVEGKDLIIVDDICDGGTTFIEIAKSLYCLGPKSLSLMVTHGIFSKGFSELGKYFSEIYTTNSFQDFSAENLLNYTSQSAEYQVAENTVLNVYKIFKPKESSDECFIIN